MRGFHFQVPPADHAKLVYCSSGAVFDAAVDLRVGSPTYGECFSLTLDAVEGRMLYLPSGVAHGFCATTADATLHYSVTSLHDPVRDSGIRWDSVGIAWPVDGVPVVSERDAGFARLDEFDSPFRVAAGGGLT